jgi:hypothetical protein
VSQIVTESPIAEYRPTEAVLADLRQKYESVVYDVTDNKTMAMAKAARKELRDVRVALEAERVRIKAPSLQRSRDIDSEAKRITAELEALEEPIDAQIKAEEGRKQREKEAAEQAERDRVAAINARFDALRAQANVPHDFTSEQINDRLANLMGSDGIPADLMSAWTHEERLVVASLRASLDKQLIYEAEQVELAALREQKAAMQASEEAFRKAEEEAKAQAAAEQAERDRFAREDAIRAEAEAKAARDAAEAVRAAERAAEEARERERLATERAEQEKAEAVRQAELKAQREAEERERARLAEEARVKAEEERKAANKAHQQRINKAAVAALTQHAGLDEETAKKVVIAIATKQIPSVSINY